MTAGEGSRRTTEAPTPLLPKAVVDELEGRNLASHEVRSSLPGVRSEICEMFQCPASGHLDDIAIQVRPTRGGYLSSAVRQSDPPTPESSGARAARAVFTTMPWDLDEGIAAA